MTYSYFELTFCSILQRNRIAIVDEYGTEYSFNAAIDDTVMYAYAAPPAFDPDPYPEGGYVVVNDDSSINIFDKNGKVLDTYYLVKITRTPLPLEEFEKWRTMAEKESENEKNS